MTDLNGWGICLSNAALVQRNISAHTLLHSEKTTMNSLPALIILAEPSASGMGSSTGQAALDLFNSLDSALRRGLASGLPIRLVTSPAMAHQARKFLPATDVIELEEPSAASSAADCMARAVANAVVSSAQAPGWLLLPADMPMLQVDTLRAVAQAVAQYTVVFPQYRYSRGHPVGFSSELFSELIRLDNERDLARITTRYPAMGIDVNDPGILMPQNGQNGLGHLRAPFQGAPALTR